MFFEKMQTRKNDGFTLVELIVVIAILAILAGIGVPAYSGYVEKANIVADQTLVGEVANALVLQYYSQGLTGSAAVALSSSGASTSGEFATTAMNNAFGSGWNTSAKLTYNGWGSGAAVSKNVVDHFSSVSDSTSEKYNADLAGVYNGTTVPSFANDVDDLFVLVKDTATMVGGDSGAGAALLQGAADKTINNTAGISASQFANYWAGSTWNSDFLMGAGNTYDGTANDLEGDMLNNAVANAAVIKARNTALAGYLRDEGFGEVYDLFADYTYDNGIVPKDAAANILGESGDAEFGNAVYKAFYTGDTPTQAEVERIQQFETALGAYFDSSAGKSQAYKDGLAYFAMMDTVNTVTPDEGSTDDSYWNDMQGAVNLYGSVARGETTLEDLNNTYSSEGFAVSGNSVVITIMGSNSGYSLNVSPAGAKPAQ